MQEGRWHPQGWEVLVGEQGAETVRTDLGMRVTAGRASHICTFIKRLLSPSSLSAIRVVSSAYLRLLIFLPAILSMNI